MTKYNFLKEWNEYEKTVKKIERIFASWERKNLTITHGRRDINVSYTYGLPYTSSSSFAMLGNTNVEAVLNADNNYKFNWLALTDNNEVVAGFTDADENEKYIVIGNI